MWCLIPAVTGVAARDSPCEDSENGNLWFTASLLRFPVIRDSAAEVFDRDWMKCEAEALYDANIAMTSQAQDLSTGS
jgi:hypothetical protein